MLPEIKLTHASAFLDCGTHGLGGAIFFGTELVHAEYLNGLGGQICPILEPLAGLDDFFRAIGEPFDLGIEIPQVYDSSKQIGEQKSIIRLALVAGACMRAAADNGCVSIVQFLPSEWKGQVKPEVLEARIKSKLTAEELERIELPAKTVEHNVWDGIGIGLKCHKRLHA